MNFEKAVDNIPLVNDLKRIASAYVIDYRNLDDEEIRSALKKTKPQYYHEGNIRSTLDNLFHKSDRDIRILSLIFLKEVLLNKDAHMASQKEIENGVHISIRGSIQGCA